MYKPGTAFTLHVSGNLLGLMAYEASFTLKCIISGGVLHRSGSTEGHPQNTATEMVEDFSLDCLNECATRHSWQTRPYERNG